MLVRVNNREQENSFVLVCVSHSQVYILFFFLILIYVYATCSKCKLVPYYVKSIDEILTFQLEGVSDTNRKRTEQRAKDISSGGPSNPCDDTCRSLIHRNVVSWIMPHRFAANLTQSHLHTFSNTIYEIC